MHQPIPKWCFRAICMCMHWDELSILPYAVTFNSKISEVMGSVLEKRVESIIKNMDKAVFFKYMNFTTRKEGTRYTISARLRDRRRSWRNFSNASNRTLPLTSGQLVHSFVIVFSPLRETSNSTSQNQNAWLVKLRRTSFYAKVSLNDYTTPKKPKSKSKIQR